MSDSICYDEYEDKTVNSVSFFYYKNESGEDKVWDMIPSGSDYNDKIKNCADECDGDSECDGFVYNIYGKCAFLANNPQETDLADTDIVTAYFKKDCVAAGGDGGGGDGGGGDVPSGYLIYENTTIEANNVEGITSIDKGSETLSEHLENCADECDGNDSCEGFIVRTNNDKNQCYFKSVSSSGYRKSNDNHHFYIKHIGDGEGEGEGEGEGDGEGEEEGDYCTPAEGYTDNSLSYMIDSNLDCVLDECEDGYEVSSDGTTCKKPKPFYKTTLGLSLIIGLPLLLILLLLITV